MDGDFSDWLRRAKDGDSDAFALIHAQYERSVRAVVRRRLGPELRRRRDSLDVTQSVFEDVLRDLPAFEDRGEKAFRHWIFLKAENKVRDAWRRTLRPGGAGAREERLATPAQERAPFAGAGPATQAGATDDGARLREVLGGLPAAQRQILELREIDGLGFAEIAERVSLPGADAARMRYARALVALRTRWNAV